MIEPKLFHISYFDNVGNHYSFLTVGVDMDDTTAEVISKNKAGHDIVRLHWYEVDEIDGFKITVDEMPEELDPKAFENFLGVKTSIEEGLDKLTIRRFK